MKNDLSNAPNCRTPDVLSRREAAKYLGVCLTTLDRLDIPKTRIRHRVMFKLDVLKKWIDDHTEGSHLKECKKK